MTHRLLIGRGATATRVSAPRAPKLTVIRGSYPCPIAGGRAPGNQPGEKSTSVLDRFKKACTGLFLSVPNFKLHHLSNSKSAVS